MLHTEENLAPKNKICSVRAGNKLYTHSHDPKSPTYHRLLETRPGQVRRKSVRVDPLRNTPPLCTGPTTSPHPSTHTLFLPPLCLSSPSPPPPHATRKFGHSTRRLQSTVAPKARHTGRARDQPHGSLWSVSSLHTEVGFSPAHTTPSHPTSLSPCTTQFFFLGAGRKIAPQATNTVRSCN